MPDLGCTSLLALVLERDETDFMHRDTQPRPATQRMVTSRFPLLPPLLVPVSMTVPSTMGGTTLVGSSRTDSNTSQESPAGPSTRGNQHLLGLWVPRHSVP